ncbi:MAG: hypothetical protein ACTTH0_00890 [Eubacteriales bacterium]
MQEKEIYGFEFQIAQKLLEDSNYFGIRLRKLTTYFKDGVTAEATILAKNTSEYEVIRLKTQENESIITCKGCGKSLKICANGDDANRKLIHFLVKIEKLEPDAKRFLESTLKFMDLDINSEISKILKARCYIKLNALNLDRTLILFNYSVESNEKIEKKDFFDAISQIMKIDEFGIIK